MDIARSSINAVSSVLIRLHHNRRPKLLPVEGSAHHFVQSVSPRAETAPVPYNAFDNMMCIHPVIITDMQGYPCAHRSLKPFSE